MAPDEMCLTSGQADQLGRWAVELYLWSTDAARTCGAAAVTP
jgi:hypothetical protein